MRPSFSNDLDDSNPRMIVEFAFAYPAESTVITVRCREDITFQEVRRLQSYAKKTYGPNVRVVTCMECATEAQPKSTPCT